MTGIAGIAAERVQYQRWSLFPLIAIAWGLFNISVVRTVLRRRFRWWFSLAISLLDVLILTLAMDAVHRHLLRVDPAGAAHQLHGTALLLMTVLGMNMFRFSPLTSMATAVASCIANCWIVAEFEPVDVTLAIVSVQFLGIGAALSVAARRQRGIMHRVKELAASPDDVVPRALAMLETGDVKAAVASLQQVLDSGGERAPVRVRWALAMAFISMDKVDLALEQMLAIKVDELSLDDLYTLARALEDKGALEGAGVLFRRIIARNFSFGDVEQRLIGLERQDPTVPRELRRALASRYRDLSFLGSGAQGTVYRAWDRELNREIAVKVPDAASLKSNEVRRRFLREARTLAQLRHPHVVQLLDVSSQGCCFYTMELVPGRDLRTLLDEKQVFALPEALSLVGPIAAALAAIHSLGIIHRDVKPENILVDQSGTPWLTDFGLVFLGNLTRVTATGITVGTPLYMAPEQLSGDAPAAAMDVYALGAVLFEMLTGRPPFRSSEFYLKLTSDAPTLRSVQPAVDVELDALLARCLSRDLRVRPGDAGDLLERLRPVASRHGAPFPVSTPLVRSRATLDVEA